MTGSQCQSCKNYLGLRQCTAYPKEIPAKIFFNEHDHRKPFKGDNGIRYEPIKSLVV